MNYEKLKRIPSPSGLGPDLGVYLGDEVVVFNLPSPDCFEDGARAFNAGGPGDIWAEVISRAVATQFDRPDARSSLVACQFDQQLSGKVTVGASRWDFGTPPNGFSASTLKGGSADVDALQSMLLLNTRNDELSRPYVSKEISHNASIAAMYSDQGLVGVVRVGNVNIGFKGDEWYRDLMERYDGYTISVGDSRVDVSDEEIRLLKKAFDEMHPQLLDLQNKFRPICWGAHGTKELAEFLIRRAPAPQDQGDQPGKVEASFWASASSNAKRLADHFGYVTAFGAILGVPMPSEQAIASALVVGLLFRDKKETVRDRQE